MKKKWRLDGNKGQSLVEMALSLPLLILMFVGLIEVGAALRNYLIIVNADREGTRFAARGRWFESSEEPTPSDAGDIFDRVVAAAGTEQWEGQPVPFLRPVDWGTLPENTTIAVTYFEIPDQVDDDDNMVVEPGVVYGPWYSGTLHVGESQIDVDNVLQTAQQDNYAFNQEYYVNQGALDIPSQDNFIIVEVWYEHQQLLGLPIFTTILPERITLYAQSRMRVTQASFR